MTSRGLKASSEGIKAAKTALTDKTLSQQKLATALGITRQPVSKFFAGEPVSRSCFVQICRQLGLSWQQVASLHEDWVSKGTLQLQPNNFDFNTLVQELRQKCQDKIQDQCNTLQMLDIARAIPLDEIYTHVSVLEEITSQQWREISDLLQDSPLESNFYQLGQSNHRKTLPGLEAGLRYSKLMVLGKSGSGKTTFLQHLAIACNQGKFQPHHVPVFIRLKEFAEDAQYEQEFNIEKYISQVFYSCGIDEETALTVLNKGRVLILLDGLDEVPLEHTDNVIREIRKFSQIYYKNKFVISCRIAAHKYRFPGFNEVELADFNAQQIEIFVKNWFVAVANQSISKAEATSSLFIQHLNLPENQRIRELARVPLLLHLICLLFQVKGQLPPNPAKLYEQVMNTLLVRWDEIRGIKRDGFYANLSLNSKKKLLAQIAAVTFIAGDYFFEQEKLQKLIAEHLPTIANLALDKSQMYLDHKSVLEGLLFQDGLLVERARGIYSFSNLGLLEYLTARNLVEKYQDTDLTSLIYHITEERWYNVFLLTLNMLSSVDETIKLMKNQVDTLVVNDHKIRQYLIWLNQKTNSTSIKNNTAAVRAFYFIYGYTFGITANYRIQWNFIENLAFNPEMALDELLFSILNCVHELKLAEENHLNIIHDFNHAHALSLTLDEAIDLVGDAEFKQELQKLKKQLPCTESNSEKFYFWWQKNSIFWEQAVRRNFIKYRNIGYDWDLNNQEIKLLQAYFNANKLITDCLERSVSINQELKQQIEDELFLAIADTKT
ncbi:NACHT domain-containing NTPase [Anabaena sp. UHCC 0399]|uniref:NACHT domain-containing protein n=1 Tax=Anabaena sp. UHCC 0399 TaxID=3110238 RepID=UPI002B1EA8B0|nr:NACHT domain-containing NTPase [Anabaena sp. UHCC 0399]MEA5567550.1 NACHT domain-containing NTPase [Anabaena sp. UHCC 0399]